MSATFYPRAFQSLYNHKHIHTVGNTSQRFPSRHSRSLSSSLILINEAGAAGVTRRQESRSRLWSCIASTVMPCKHKHSGILTHTHTHSHMLVCHITYSTHTYTNTVTHLVAAYRYAVSCFLKLRVKWYGLNLQAPKLQKVLWNKQNVCRLNRFNDPIASEVPQSLCVLAKRYRSTTLAPSLLNETFPKHHYKRRIYAIRQLGLQWYQNESAKIMSRLTSAGRACFLCINEKFYVVCLKAIFTNSLLENHSYYFLKRENL